MKTIEELRAAYAATTQGEWMSQLGGEVLKRGTGVVVAQCYITPLHDEYMHNAAFIALAHNEFPALLDEIERLRETVRQLREENDRLAAERDEARGN